MSTTTLDQLGPVLVSELPPATAAPSLWAQLMARLTARLAERGFERALRQAQPGEVSDLLAAARRG